MGVMRTVLILSIGIILCVTTSLACASSESLPESDIVEDPNSERAIQPATDGDTVSVHYTGILDSGEVFDSSMQREPLSFVLGSGQMIPGFDAAVQGLTVGESVTVRLEPEEAYGELRDDLILDFPIDQLPEGLAEGGTVMFQNGAPGLIINVTDVQFTVDANHSLAGENLTFEIELVSIQ